MSTEIHANVAKEVGIFGLKTLLTLNSGAAIILLSFVGNIYRKADNAITLDLSLLKCAMSMFLAGITGAMISVIITYVFSQKSVAGRPLPDRALTWMVMPAALSFLFFAGGFIFALCAL